MRTIYTYGLVQLRDREHIRYVGVSWTPEMRLYGHLIEAKNGTKTHKCNWIREVLSQGDQVTIVILEVKDENTWVESETWWIKHLREQGHKLTNASDGGDSAPGFKWSNESIEKLKKSLAISTQKPEYKKYRAELAKKIFTGRKQSKEHREKISLAHKRNFERTKNDPVEIQKRSERARARGKILIERRKNNPEQMKIFKEKMSSTMKAFFSTEKGMAGIEKSILKRTKLNVQTSSLSSDLASIPLT